MCRITVFDGAQDKVFRSVQPLILASSSPRRKELLSSMGLTFDVVPSGVEETAGGQDEDTLTLVQKWACDKARAVSKLNPASWVLAADTVVLLGRHMFGKPSDGDEAAFMLRELGGKEHEVVSAICLINVARKFFGVRSVKTKVMFKDLSFEEIAAYIETGEPFDKAGSYGIQGKGAFLVRSVHGSYTNVVGLPLCETLEWLTEQGVIAPSVGA